MATLALTWTELKQIVGRFLGWKESGWSSDQTTRIERIVESAYREMLVPPNGYVWSFLAPATTLNVTVAGGSTYNAPADFGGFCDVPTIQTTSTLYPPLEVTGEGRIRALAAASNTTGAPAMIAVRPKAGQTVEQPWQFLIWPTPDGNYTLAYRYNVNPDFSATKPHPLGGAEVAALLKELCLAVADRDENDTVGAHAVVAQELMAATIQQDARRHAPRSLGYNGEGEHREGVRLAKGRYGLYEGVLYGD